jgi:predicted amidohydrolase
LNLTLCQLNIVPGDKATNIEKCKIAASHASEKGADVIIYPELTLTGYSPTPKAISEPPDGPSFHQMRNIARSNNLNLIFGLPTLQQGKCFNTLFVIDRKGELIYTYNKIHPFSYTLEDVVYAAGDSYDVFTLDGARCSAFICYDLRFPELFTSIAKEVDIFFVIANWPDARREHWLHLLKARAIDSLAYVVGVNRVGSDGQQEYPGCSSVFDPWGNNVIGTESEEGNLRCTIDPIVVSNIRSKFSLLEDRKPNIYKH